MKRLTAMVLILMMLVSSAMAQSLFPAPDSNPQGEKELAASYSTMADVQPVETGVDPRADLLGHYQTYINVSLEDYYAYGTYLGERGYQLVEQRNGGAIIELVLAKGDITFTVTYNPDACVLGEVYPYGVEYEKRDPLKGYTEVEANTTFNLGNMARISIKSVSYINYVTATRPSVTVDMQNLSQSNLYSSSMFNVNFHVFVGDSHFTFKANDCGRLEFMASRYALSGMVLDPMEKGTVTYSFATTQGDIQGIQPDRMAITFEAGNSKYVYNIQ